MRSTVPKSETAVLADVVVAERSQQHALELLRLRRIDGRNLNPADLHPVESGDAETPHDVVHPRCAGLCSCADAAG